MIDDIIVAVNELPKALMTGQYVQFCSLIVQIVQALAQLKADIGGAENVSSQSNE